MNKQFYIGAGLVAVLAIGLILWLLRSQQATKEGYDSILSADRDSIIYYRNGKNEQIAKMAQVQIALDIYKYTHPEEVNDVLNDFGIKISDLRSVLKVSFQARNHGETKFNLIERVHDTISKIIDRVVIDSGAFKVNDGYLDFTLRTIKGNDFWEDKAEWSYTYSDSAAFVGTVKRNGLFGLGKETYWINGKFKNPNASITSLRDIQIKEFKDKRFGIGPAIMWSPFEPNKPLVGISLQYNLIKF